MMTHLLEVHALLVLLLHLLLLLILVTELVVVDDLADLYGREWSNAAERRQIDEYHEK